MSTRPTRSHARGRGEQRRGPSRLNAVFYFDMPRSSRSSGGSRPAARSTAPAGSRGMHTMSAAPSSRYAPPPVQQRAAPQPQQAAPVASQGPGLFGQVRHGLYLTNDRWLRLLRVLRLVLYVRQTLTPDCWPWHQ